MTTIYNSYIMFGMKTYEDVLKNTKVYPDKTTLIEKLNSGKQLNIKVGFDPTKPDIHLGHTVILRKLRQFQDLGHKVSLIVGDFTAAIGDPTGKDKTRPKLELKEIKHNANTYVNQLSKILDTENKNLFQLYYNSAWLNKINFLELLDFLSNITVAQMFERENFKNRYNKNTPIFLNEFLYPLAQGLDSIAVDANVEVGGTDQTFNLMVGRDIQRIKNMEEQIVITLPLLVGNDGKKMSKSLENYIGITDSPKTMYTKLMKVENQYLIEYFELCTDLDKSHIEYIIEHNKKDTANKVLATLITAAYLGNKVPERIDTNFLYGVGLQLYFSDEKTLYLREHKKTKISEIILNIEKDYEKVSNGEIPKDIYVMYINRNSVSNFSQLFTSTGLTNSNTEAKNLMKQGGLKVNGENLTINECIPHNIDTLIIQRGKAKFVKVIFQN